jgi:hypothetical protein
LAIISILALKPAMPVVAEQYKLIGNYVLLSVSSNDGRFLLYGRSDKKDTWTPLLFEDFPSTTYFKFYQSNGSIIPFSEGGKNNFSETKIIGNSIVYFWQNSEYRIELNYHFTALNDDSSANTLYIDLAVKNLTEKEKSVNYFFCIDTFLGEKLHKHFLVDEKTVINSEKELNVKQLPSSVVSYDEHLKYGINILFDKDNLIKPTRVFFANWKRVDTQIGLYKTADKQEFDLKPYSINDSAFIIEYRDQKINAGTKLDYRFVININNNIKSLQKIVENKNEVSDQTVTSDQTNDKKVRIKKPIENDKNLQTPNDKNFKMIDMDLSDILNLIDSQNNRIKSENELTEKDNQLLKERLELIKKKKENSNN